MKILIYVLGGDHWIAGIQYAHSLLRALALLPENERPRVVLSLVKSASKYRREFAAYPHVTLDRPVAPRSLPDFVRAAAARLRLVKGKAPRISMLSDSCTVVFPAKIAGLAPPAAEKLLWIPDFQYKRLPHLTPESDHRLRDKRYADLFLDGSILVLSSEAVKADFEELYPNETHLSARVLRFCTLLSSSDYAPDPRGVIRKYGLPEKFVCVPNQMSPHKGHDTVFEAIARLKKKGLEIPVACTGASFDYRTDECFRKLKSFLAAEGLERQIRLLGLIPRYDQIQVLRESALVLQASRFEGWSTVVEDARTLGKNLLCSDLAVHREQNPPHACYFKTGDASDLAAKLADLWPRVRSGADPARETKALERSIENGRRYAERFVAIAQEAHRCFAARAERSEVCA